MVIERHVEVAGVRTILTVRTLDGDTHSKFSDNKEQVEGAIDEAASNLRCGLEDLLKGALKKA